MQRINRRENNKSAYQKMNTPTDTEAAKQRVREIWNAAKRTSLTPCPRTLPGQSPITPAKVTRISMPAR